MEPQPPVQTPSSDPAPVSGWNAGPPAAPLAQTARPGVVTAAAVVLIIIGVLAVLVGLLIVLGGALIGGAGGGAFGDQLPNLPAAIGGFAVVFGAVVVAFGVLDVLSGIYVLLGRSWARILAIILAALGVLFWLASLANLERGGAFVPLLLVAAHAFVIWAVSANGRWFAGR